MHTHTNSNTDTNSNTCSNTNTNTNTYNCSSIVLFLGASIASSVICHPLHVIMMRQQVGAMTSRYRITRLSVCLSVPLSVGDHMSLFLSVSQSICLPNCMAINPVIYLSIHLSNLSIYLPIYHNNDNDSTCNIPITSTFHLYLSLSFSLFLSLSLSSFLHLSISFKKIVFLFFSFSLSLSFLFPSLSLSLSPHIFLDVFNFQVAACLASFTLYTRPLRHWE